MLPRTIQEWWQMTKLDNALVLITGATGGFGREMTRQCLAAGSQIIISDRDDGGLVAFKSEFGAGEAGIKALIAADLSTAGGSKRLFDEVKSRGLQPDILINNAGIALGGRIDLIPTSRWEELMQINLLAPMRLSNLFTPMMVDRRSGHIVNIASLAGWVGARGIAAYCAAKFGLRGFSESMSEDLKDYGVKVSAVYPSFSRTPILDSEQFGYKKKMKVPEHLVNEPSEVVAAILKGIERDQLHIFPDKIARRVHYLKRFCPGVLAAMNKRMLPRLENG